MTRFRTSIRTRILLLLAIAGLAMGGLSATATPLPNPAVDSSLSKTPGSQTAVFAGGCFWGIQAVFKRVKGVTQATSGYSGGTAETAHYEIVSSGTTGHAESVKVTFDPAQVSYGQLLKVFFSVAHNPTELNRQGPDTGRQYRSSVFYVNDEQQRIAKAYIAQLGAAKVFAQPIVTEVVPYKAFYAAEDYHQDYAETHKMEPYIVFNDLPKIAALKSSLPDLYVQR